MSRRLLALVCAAGFMLAACGDADSESVDAGDTPVTSNDNTGSTPSDDAGPGDSSGGAVDGPDSSLPVSGDGNAAAGGTRPADGVDTYAIADLTVFITHPDFDSVRYQLSCLGDTATIDDPSVGVDADAACRALLDPEVATRLIDGPATDQACTEIFGGPDVAEIGGTLAGSSVVTSVHRANGCGIYDWDELLAAVLPAARPFS